MADRYWVGGTGTWDATAGTKWAATSGGAGGQTVPTSADNVFLDAASGAVTVTVSGSRPCLDFTCTGFTGTLAGTSTPNLQCYGNLIISSGMTYSTANSPTITMLATTTGKTVTTAGKTLRNITFNGVGGEWTLQDEIVNSENITVTAGTLNTNNFNIKSSNIISTGSSTRAINLGSSTAYAIYVWNMTSTGMTFTAGTSTVRCDITNNGGSFTGAGLTYNNAQIGTTISTSTNQNINGNNTFNGTLTLLGTANVTADTRLNGTNVINNLVLQTSTVGLTRFALASNQTVSGSFTTSTTNATTRIYLLSTTFGTVRTITVNGTASPTDVDFQDITIAGTASPISGTRLGNAGNNSGITFDAAKTVYWGLLSGSQNWEATGWATSSGGTPAINNFPLAQDTAVIDNSSTASTITGLTPFFIGAIDSSTRTSALTLSITGKFICGSVLLGSGITATSFNNTFSGNAAQTLTTSGKTLTGFTVNKTAGSTLSLGDALTTSGRVSLTTGGFDAVSYNVTINDIASSNSNVRSLSMGSGLWTLTGTGTVWDLDTSTNITFTKGTADILLSSTSTSTRNFYSSGTAGSVLEYNKLTIGGTTGISTLFFRGSTTFTELASAKTVAHTIQVRNGRTLTVDTWSVTGTTGNVVTINTDSANTQASIAITNKTSTIDYLNIRDIVGTSITPVTFWAGANSTNTSNNTGIAFANGTTTQAYILTTGTSFTTPVDWNNAANSIYLFGGGGGGSGSNITGTNRAGGGGGGGGGFTLLTNQTISGAISYAIGAGGTAGSTGSGALVTAGTGGTTSWNTTSTSYSGYFDGNGDYLSIPDNTALNMGTSTFTLEAWIYLTSAPGSYATILDKDGKNGVTWPQYAIYVDSSYKVKASFSSVANTGGSPTVLITSTTTLTQGQWYHVAVTRTGTNATLWVNGVSNGTSASVPTTLNNGARPLLIGYEDRGTTPDPAFNFPGNISNLRIVKGTAVYTANFTPSTTPLTAITNTSLLTCQSATFIDNSTNNFTITVVGNTSTTTISPFFTAVTSATGGTGGSALATGTPASTGGTGGTGTFTGGTGGLGGTNLSSAQNGGGGGGGAGGVNGAGANGGNGADNDNSGGGGGGNGGGSAGGNAIVGTSGSGGNNSLGSGGGASVTAAAGNTGGRGGGGSGGEGTFAGGKGGNGADILGGVGSGGGAGGSGNAANTATSGLYGGGGAGGGNGATNAFNGAAGAQGAIIIVYTISGSPIYYGTGAINATAIVSGLANYTAGAAGSINVTAFVASNANAIFNGIGFINGTATVTANGDIAGIITGSASIYGEATATAFATKINSATAYIYGEAIVTASGTLSPIITASGQIVGNATVTALGSKVNFGTGVINATGTVTALGGLVYNGVGSINGITTVSALGGLVSGGVASINAYALVSGNAQTIYGGVGSIYAEALMSGYANVQYNCFGSVVCNAIVTADGHPIGYNWENVAIDTNTWNDVNINTNGWTEVSSNTNNWLRQG